MSQNIGFHSFRIGSGEDGRRILGGNNNSGGGIVGGCYSSLVGGGSYSHNKNAIEGNVGGNLMVSNSNNEEQRYYVNRTKVIFKEVEVYVIFNKFAESEFSVARKSYLLKR